MEAICEYCGTLHAGTCWRVKAIEYYDNGCVKRVELIPRLDNGQGDALPKEAVDRKIANAFEVGLNEGRYGKIPT